MNLKAMLLSLITFGSRGDVQPYVALGLGLKHAGFAVRLCTHPEFEPFIRSYGLDFHAVEGNPTDLLASSEGEQLQKTGKNPLEFLIRVGKFTGKMMVQFLRDCWEGAKDADALIFSVTGWYAANHIMEKLGIPGVAAYLQPVNTTAEFPSFFAPVPNFNKWINRASYRFAQEVGWPFIRPYLNYARRQVLGLPPMRRFSPFPRLERERAFPVLYGFSQVLVPKPPDWAENVEVCGFWFLPEQNMQPIPQSVVEFVNKEGPLVYLGFGSMREREPRRILEICAAALRKVGMRGVVLTNQGQSQLPDHILAVADVPHAWLFPRCAVVAHHAGAGTCAATLRAGVPSVTVPYFGDQPFWADRLHRLGAGTRPVHRRALSVDRLVKEIERATRDPALHNRAGELGQSIRSENGVARAVEAIQRLLS